MLLYITKSVYLPRLLLLDKKTNFIKVKIMRLLLRNDFIQKQTNFIKVKSMRLLLRNDFTQNTLIS